MATQRTIGTGVTGKAGHSIVKHPLERGDDVVNVDVRHPDRTVWSRAALISSPRAQPVLAWEQEFGLV